MTWFEQTLTERDYEAFFAGELRRLEAEVSLMEEVVMSSRRVLAIFGGRWGGEQLDTSPVNQLAACR